MKLLTYAKVIEPITLGLMSGTSTDGVSVTLASFKQRSFDLIDYKTFPYPKEISKKLLNASHLNAIELSSLNFQLGEIFAKCSLNLLRKNRISFDQVSAIGSHGQTIVHAPEGLPPSTLQIGEPALIAEKTGITVVSDFRPGDIAAGGKGAPLIPFFDHYFFGEGRLRAFQNIGGIANVTVVGKEIKRAVAFDTGPGNCLMDWAVQKFSNGKLKFDRDGCFANKGTAQRHIIAEMARDPYFKKSPPKATGKELFNEHFIPRPLKKMLKISPEDTIRTLTYFTAFTISESYKRFVPNWRKLNEAVISGGGAFNKTLIQDLKKLLEPVPVRSIQKYGIHPQAKEPLAFAFFALRAVQGKINHLPSGTGAKKAVILGKITPGKNFKGIR